MNEVINQLVEQASYRIIATDDAPIISTEFNKEKFAELIVQECLNTLCVKMYDLGCDLSNLPLWYKALSQTEKHFGIEYARFKLEDE